jgi:hypothetical protein
MIKYEALGNRERAAAGILKFIEMVSDGAHTQEAS